MVVSSDVGSNFVCNGFSLVVMLSISVNLVSKKGRGIFFVSSSCVSKLQVVNSDVLMIKCLKKCL